MRLHKLAFVGYDTETDTETVTPVIYSDSGLIQMDREVHVGNAQEYMARNDMRLFPIPLARLVSLYMDTHPFMDWPSS